MKRGKRLTAIALLYVVIGTWKGYVALFDQGASEPRQVFPYTAASLPPADQAALEKGIVIRNERDLKQLLEDYLS